MDRSQIDWSPFRSGLLRRIGLLTALLSFLTAAAGLALLFTNMGFLPVAVLLCTYPIGFGLLLAGITFPGPGPALRLP